MTTDNEAKREKTFEEELPHVEERIKEVFNNYHNPNGCEDRLEICVIRDCKRTIRKAKEEINRQKAENDKLKKDVSVSRDAYISIQDKYEYAKAEAYKEFAQKIKQEIKEAYDSNIEVLNEHFEKHRGCFNDTFVGIIEGKNNALLGLSDFIDNLLKEMVGEKE